MMVEKVIFVLPNHLDILQRGITHTAFEGPGSVVMSNKYEWCPGLRGIAYLNCSPNMIIIICLRFQSKVAKAICVSNNRKL